MANIPSSDPLHPSMSGDDVDPALVLTEIQKLYQEIQGRYGKAKWGQDPVARRALGECLDAIRAVADRWVAAAHRWV